MSAKCFAAILLCTMMIGFSTQQVVVPAYSAAYYPTAYAYPSVYSPYVAAAYSPVWAWGSNKNKGGPAPTPAAAPSTLLNNQKPTSA